MAQISFNAKKEDETAGGGTRFPKKVRGFYNLKISAVTDGMRTSDQAKNPGVPMTQFKINIIGGGEQAGALLFHSVTWIDRGTGEKPTPGHGMAVHFLHACGMPFDGHFAFDENDFMGMEFPALLEVENYEKEKDGKTYLNEKYVIRAIYTGEHPQPKELPPPPAAKTAKTARHPGLAAAQAHND